MLRVCRDEFPAIGHQSVRRARRERTYAKAASATAVVLPVCSASATAFAKLVGYPGFYPPSAEPTESGAKLTISSASFTA